VTGAVTIETMKVSCADCGCVVDKGVRLVPCGKRDCCCQHLPVRA
jgi:hypothetical protein